jgi:hypothetical protein
LIDRFSGIPHRHGKGPLGKGDEMTRFPNELFETKSFTDEDSKWLAPKKQEVKPKLKHKPLKAAPTANKGNVLNE